MKKKPIITKKKNYGYLVDWNRFLSPKKKRYTLNELTNACEAAGNWTDCACGRTDPRIPRHDGGRPMDAKLTFFGNRFYDAIHYMYINFINDEKEDFSWALMHARKIIRQIDIRSAQILKELKLNP